MYQFDVKYHYIKDENYFSVVVGLVKGSRAKKPHLEICLPSFPEHPVLCSFSLRDNNNIVKSIFGGHKHIDKILLVKTYCSCLTLSHINW